jgi:hypothetical protein
MRSGQGALRSMSSLPAMINLRLSPPAVLASDAAKTIVARL